MIKRVMSGVILAASTVALTACDGKYSEPYKDSPVSHERNDDPADIIEMPDGFSNIASKCDGPNRIYVAYHGDKPFAAIQVVKDDPRCK